MIWYLCEHRVARQDLFVAEAKSGTRRAHATLPPFLAEGGPFRCIGPNAKKTKETFKSHSAQETSKKKNKNKKHMPMGMKRKFQKKSVTDHDVTKLIQNCL